MTKITKYWKTVMRKASMMAALAVAVGYIGLDGTKHIIMEGTMPMIMEGTPPLRGVPYPTL